MPHQRRTVRPPASRRRTPTRRTPTRRTPIRRTPIRREDQEVVNNPRRRVRR